MKNRVKKNDNAKKDAEENAVRFLGAMVLVMLIVVAAMLFLVAWFFRREMRGFGTFISLIVPVAIPMLFLLLLVVVCLRWVVAEEDQNFFILFLGSVRRAAFVKKNWILDNEYEAVPAPGYRRSIGGLFFYFWPLEWVFRYDGEWTKAHLSDGTMEAVTEKDVRFILVKQQYSYALEVTGRGTVTEDKVPIEYRIILRAEITNPYKALFDERNWFNALMGLVGGAVREYISSHTYETLIVDPKQPPGTPPRYIDEEIWEEIGPNKRKIHEELKEKHGVNLIGLQFTNLQVEENYQKMITRKTEGEYEAEYRKKSTLEPFREYLAEQLGMDVTTLQTKMLEEDFHTKYAAEINRAHDMVKIQISAKDGSMSTVDFLGQGNTLTNVATLVAAGKNLIAGDSKSEEKEEESKKKPKPAEQQEEEEDEEEEAAIV